MFNPTVYGKTSSAPHLGVLGVAGINWDEIISQGKEALNDVSGENLSVPSKNIAKEVAQAHGEATGEAAGAEIWESAKPFAIGGLILLGGIFLVMALKRKKRR